MVQVSSSKLTICMLCVAWCAALQPRKMRVVEGLLPLTGRWSGWKCPLPPSSTQSCRSGQTAQDTELRLVPGNGGVGVQAPLIRRKP